MVNLPLLVWLPLKTDKMVQGQTDGTSNKEEQGVNRRTLGVNSFKINEPVRHYADKDGQQK
ncbi:hypothetical protein AWY79_13440 [Pseudodesulfovibrio indicus]|uniref:Uncharacterized protein n=1 Tax=Pseudodesulfovibrio indicus TaxID=1716143 RepID=A0ABM5YX72_9BACT|nr:hypothetical protein AWY79_13440 [Pseudodesulfovibrio indicus]